MSAIIVGERDAKVKVKSMLVSAVIVGEQDTRQRKDNVGVCCHCWRARHKVKEKAMLVFDVIVGEQDTR